MAERQRVPHVGQSTEVSHGVTRGYRVQIESIDGNAIEIEAQGTDQIGQLRQTALHEMGQVTSNPQKYVVMDSNDRVLDDGMTVDQVLQEGQSLQFQLIPQAVFGPTTEGATDV